MHAVAVEGEHFSYDDLDGCESTLDTFRPEGSGVGFGKSKFLQFCRVPLTRTMNAGITPADNSTVQLGDSLFYWASQAFQSNNLTEYRQAESALQILLIDFMSTSPERTAGDTNPTVLCHILDETAATSSALGMKHAMTASIWSFVVLGLFLLL